MIVDSSTRWLPLISICPSTSCAGPCTGGGEAGGTTGAGSAYAATAAHAITAVINITLICRILYYIIFVCVKHLYAGKLHGKQVVNDISTEGIRKPVILQQFDKLKQRRFSTGKLSKSQNNKLNKLQCHKKLLIEHTRFSLAQTLLAKKR